MTDGGFDSSRGEGRWETLRLRLGLQVIKTLRGLVSENTHTHLDFPFWGQDDMMVTKFCLPCIPAQIFTVSKERLVSSQIPGLYKGLDSGCPRSYICNCVMHTSKQASKQANKQANKYYDR